MSSGERYNHLASDESIERATVSLTRNGIRVVVARDRVEAKRMITAMIPRQSEVMTMQSVTINDASIYKLINESGNYRSVRKVLDDDSLSKIEKQRIGAAPEWAVGSVHAVTEDGKVVIASATGSQLPAYAYGSLNVLWIVGTQKIVKDLEEATRRIHEYVFPLENERAMRAYGIGSGENKILIFNREVRQGRVHLIFVKENIGF